MATQHTNTTLQKLLKAPKAIMSIVFVAIVIVIFVIALTTYILRIGKVGVSVTVAPYTAKLTLNGTKIQNNKKIYLEKGNYHLIVENEHFETKEMDLTISDNQHYIATVMVPTDEEGEKYKETHKRQFSNAEGAVALALNAEGKDYQEKYPIIKYLPINNRFYSISYHRKESGEPIINIKTEPSYLDVAIAKLKTLKNVSLPDYDININLENTFSIPEESSSDVEKLAKKVSANGYSQESGQFITDEFYLAVYTTQDPDSLMQNARYLALFKKSGEDWKIVAKPQPILTHFNTPDIETDILNSANSFAGQ